MAYSQPRPEPALTRKQARKLPPSQLSAIAADHPDTKARAAAKREIGRRADTLAKASRQSPWTPFALATNIFDPAKLEALKADLSAASGVTPEDVERVYRETMATETWLNSRYQVQVRRPSAEELADTEQMSLIHLSIKRIDKAPIHDWRDLQRIKNEIIGPEFEAIELYPAQSRVVDTANQYHLWVFAEEGYRLPIGWNTGFTMAATDPASGTVQREFEA